jgi:hypothetical protein
MSHSEEDDSMLIPIYQRNRINTISSNNEDERPLLPSTPGNGRDENCDSPGNKADGNRVSEDIVHAQHLQHALLPAVNKIAPLTLNEALVQLMDVFPDIEYQYALDMFRSYVRDQQLPESGGVVTLEGIIELIAQKETYPTEGARRRALKRKREEEEKDPHNFRQWASDVRKEPTPEYFWLV